MPFSTRIQIAHNAGLALPDGPIGVFGATVETDLSALPHAQIISRDARVHDRFPKTLETAPGGLVASALVVPREKARARALVSEATAACSGHLIIDGQKTDGIEPMIKALKAKGAALLGPISKAHGKLIWCENCPDVSDWAAAPQQVDGLMTLPGVFSADKVDAGSRALAQHLPQKLGTHIADLGAGWGWLSAQMADGERDIHMVEADGIALDCARQNVPGATAHWADVTRWQTPMLMDAVVMNPPFHEGRKGVPELGQAFIAKAASILKPSGHLYMVANRHLPYEEALERSFGKVEVVAGPPAFKLFHASRPSRRGR
ncbi:MAG: methyltransferase [Marinovum sp.]|nr:methyltransferase [Marinovum sp.]